jgi:hypothetical protein
MVPRDPSERRDEVRQRARYGDSSTHVTDVTLFCVCEDANVIAIILVPEPALASFAIFINHTHLMPTIATEVLA